MVWLICLLYSPKNATKVLTTKCWWVDLLLLDVLLKIFLYFDQMCPKMFIFSRVIQSIVLIKIFNRSNGTNKKVFIHFGKEFLITIGKIVRLFYVLSYFAALPFFFFVHLATLFIPKKKNKNWGATAVTYHC